MISTSIATALSRDAYTRLNAAHTPLDLLTVCDELERTGQLHEVGGSAYLTGLIASTDLAQR